MLMRSLRTVEYGDLQVVRYGIDARFVTVLSLMTPNAIVDNILSLRAPA